MYLDLLGFPSHRRAKRLQTIVLCGISTTILLIHRHLIVAAFISPNSPLSSHSTPSSQPILATPALFGSVAPNRCSSPRLTTGLGHARLAPCASSQ